MLLKLQITQKMYSNYILGHYLILLNDTTTDYRLIKSNRLRNRLLVIRSVGKKYKYSGNSHENTSRPIKL